MSTYIPSEAKGVNKISKYVIYPVIPVIIIIVKTYQLNYSFMYMNGRNDEGNQFL